MSCNLHAESISYAIHALKPYKPYINAIYLYGSCARNEQMPTSDVDIFLQITSDTPDEIIRKMRIAAMPKDYQLPEVDIHFSKDSGFGDTKQFVKNLQKGGKITMGEESMSYFDMAENDYQYLKRDFDERRVGNLLCHAAQSICERYLKHIINEYAPDNINTTDILKTHSLTRLVNFVEDNIADFSCNWNSVLLADGYYFSARYPGVDAVMVRTRDVENCAAAVEITRDAVIQYELKQNKEEKECHPELEDTNDIIKDKNVIDAITEFDKENREPSTEKSSVLDGLIAEAEKSASTAEKSSAYNKNNKEIEA